MADGYEIVSIDDLDRYDGWSKDDPVLRPLRRRVGFRPFGLNCWEANAVGGHVIEPHSEKGGDEELYVVLRGRATFTVAGETIDAPVGTLVHVPPGTAREAVAAEEGTIVLAAGAKPGEAFSPKGWEDFHIAVARFRAGEPNAIEEVLTQHPHEWQGFYNAACLEALDGNTDRAFDYLRRAIALDPKAVREYAAGDEDFAALHDDQRWKDLIA
ncbi:MAG TPA: cupin domain-containing protein [Gaiellaceae bacterium]|nr:cupin domain-containing protein [Gaiellaceae bacterium]